MKNLKRIIYLQAIFSQSYLKESIAVSPAANLWQYEFIKTLKKNEIKVLCVGNNYEPIFPKGKLFVKTSKKNLVKDFEHKSFNYINLPFLRNILLERKYYNYLSNFSFEKGDIILTYNHSFLSNVAVKIKKRLKIPWYSIIADLNTPKNANRYIYLNSKYYEKNKENGNAIFIDGCTYPNLLNAYKKNKKKKNKIILYAGTIGGHAGVSYLIKAFNQIKNNRVELWLCGKGHDHDIEKLIDTDKRIKLFGYVSKKRLEELSNIADIFINPRKSDGNETNFPSKILFYLPFKKPIISTRSGLSPKYNNVLFLLNDEKIETLINKINYVLSLNVYQRNLLKNRIKDFIKKYSWDVQVKKFIDWSNKKIKLK
jgi:glycosyltransferase involved in cell wall biosynthesis